LYGKEENGIPPPSVGPKVRQEEAIMRVGIIVHSRTGNTLSVAVRLKERLVAAGHTAVIERVEAENDLEADVAKIKLRQTPNIGAYDVLVFAAPVRGLSLSPVMQAFLATIGSLHEKRVGCFVTQAFPYEWMGGKRAVHQAVEICRAKGAEPYGTGVVNWMRPIAKRELLISQTVDRLSALR
jgi:flavodoxin